MQIERNTTWTCIDACLYAGAGALIGISGSNSKQLAVPFFITGLSSTALQNLSCDSMQQRGFTLANNYVINSAINLAFDSALFLTISKMGMLNSFQTKAAMALICCNFLKFPVFYQIHRKTSHVE